MTCVAAIPRWAETRTAYAAIPQLADLTVEDTTAEVLNGHDVIILALPHGASGALAAQLDPGAVVVDLGADHRLEERSAWDAFYGGEFFDHWTYGMPELITGKSADGEYTRQRDLLPGAKRIAGPGCNVTATTLAMQPAIAEGLVERRDLVADLVVGYSGAGKNLKRANLLAARRSAPPCPTAWAARIAISPRFCRTSPMRQVWTPPGPRSSRSDSRRYSRRWRVASSPRSARR